MVHFFVILAVQASIWTPRGSKVHKKGQPLKKYIPTANPFDTHFGNYWHLFSFRGLRDLKKGGPRAYSEQAPLFYRFWDLSREPQEGSCLHGSSILSFPVGPEKASQKMGAKIEHRGIPNLSYTHVGMAWGDFRAPLLKANSQSFPRGSLPGGGSKTSPVS